MRSKPLSQFRIGTYSSPLGELVVRNDEICFKFPGQDNEVQFRFRDGVFHSFVVNTSESIVIPDPTEIDSVVTCPHIGPVYLGKVYNVKRENGGEMYVCEDCYSDVSKLTSLVVLDKRIWEVCRGRNQ